jgi:hypothetical protein
MNAWDHLPNAKHIDWVLASVKQYPAIWASATTTWSEVSRARVLNHAAIIAAAPHAVWGDRAAAWYPAQQAARAIRGGPDKPEPALVGAQNVILALIIYDECAHLLDMPSEQLKTWALLSEQPAAVLLLPAVIARERIRELESIKA